jgi:uncharacterized protein
MRLTGASVAVCRLASDHPVRPWMCTGPLWSITRTADELSVICDIAQVPAAVCWEGPFDVFQVEGPLDFALTGIVASLSAPLAERQIPIFVTSTFDTDYLLIREGLATAAVVAWTEAGLTVR